MASGSVRDEGYDEDRLATKVDQNFHCAVCLKILKDPLMCPRNQHLFCTGCITEHLNYSQTCPTCKDELTLETLIPAPRFLTTYLSELDICCDYHARGCPEFVRVGMLKTHVANCGFSPVVCRNEGCTVEINKRDRIFHETEVCELRKVLCHECTEIRKEINKIKANMREVRENQSNLKDSVKSVHEHMNEVKECLSKDIKDIKDKFQVQMCSMREEILKRVATMVTELKEEVGNVDKTKVIQESFQGHVTETREEIFVAGGWGLGDSDLSSVEMLSPSENKWLTLPPMKTARARASSFVYKDQLFVAGGRTPQGDTNTIVTMTMNHNSHQWREFPARLPANLVGHKCVVHNDQMSVVGGYDDDEDKHSDTICEVLLVPPYSTNLLCRMPQRRDYLSVELYNNRILIIGGSTNDSHESSMDSIAEYDIYENEYRELAKLPFAVNDMATVRWGSYVIVMGGYNKEGEVLNTVVIFDIEKKECHTLPSMKYRRGGCAAVVSGNSVVVMGGQDENETYLKSVECFRFDRYTWEDLPAMTEARSWHTAVVKPGNVN